MKKNARPSFPPLQRPLRDLCSPPFIHGFVPLGDALIATLAARREKGTTNSSDISVHHAIERVNVLFYVL
jgi:hypothetical protein